jgi:fucokinase
MVSHEVRRLVLAQVNGLTGGAKATSCDPSVFPFKLQIERLHLGCDALNSLDERLMLAFTGKTRLAKNLLQNVLRRWSAQTTEIHEVVEGLVSGAKRSRDALLANDLDAVGECLLSYWEQKKVMAGLQSGVEPTSVKRIIDVLLSHRAISGASLCGAGGGGFLVLIRSRKATEEDVRRIVADCVPDSGITWHQCAVSESGLHVEVLDDVTQEQLSASRTYNC